MRKREESQEAFRAYYREQNAKRRRMKELGRDRSISEGKSARYILKDADGKDIVCYSLNYVVTQSGVYERDLVRMIEEGVVRPPDVEDKATGRWRFSEGAVLAAVAMAKNAARLTAHPIRAKPDEVLEETLRKTRKAYNW